MIERLLEQIKANTIDIVDAEYYGAITDEESALLAAALAANTSAHTLYLPSFYASNDSTVRNLKFFRLWGNCFKRNGSLRNIVFYDFFYCSPEGARVLADAFEVNKTIRRISIVEPYEIEPKSVPYLTKMLEKNTGVTSLELSGCKFGNEGVKIISEFFDNNRLISTLDISNTGFSVAGTVYISKMLETNTTIRVIRLG